jgi:uncharacterized protein
MRVFLDANTLFSAAKSDGAVRRLFHLLLERGHECWVDEYVMIEARRNLAAKDPKTLIVLDTLLKQMQLASLQPAGRPAQSLDWLPEKDRPVLAAAIRLRCDVLLTGDRTHFGSAYGRVFAGVMIHSPRSLTEVLLP